MRIVVGSLNQGKIAEYRRMFDELQIEVESMQQAGVAPDVDLPEDGDTFYDNALSKTRALQEMIGGWTMGDDSGLVVDALGGAPGVYSARYAGYAGRGKARDRANLDKLLTAMEGVADENRTAHFECAIVLLGPVGQIVSAHGTCQGRIIRAGRGTSGFGYDPVFLPDGFEQTMAELSMDAKNLISHRGLALAALIEKVRRSKII
ncbi:MAG: RdgB/HAM1 family non-canonical purine NTP pyrophosphatase [Deltaproteobacteria bacterium]|nr:RdgB/HAM1 family non-canonical purine NTP pyrophosphatase [Deltaproteobacteria bacterium]